MGQTSSERRMAENEVVFREYNERVLKGFEELTEIAKEDGQEAYVANNDHPLFFYCECSDENCRQRVQLKPSRYATIHKQRDRFIILCGHETRSIEQIISTEADFCIVEKFITPLRKVTKLQKTETNNV